MKNSINTALILCIMLAAVVSCDIDEDFPLASQAIVNGDMEIQSSINETLPQGWQVFAFNFFAPNNYLITRTDAAAASGNHALAIQAHTIDSEQEFWYVRQNIDLADFQMNHPMQLKFKVKTQDLQGNGFNIFVIVRASNTRRVSLFISSVDQLQTHRISGTNDWQTFYLNIPATGENVSLMSLDLAIGNATTGTVYFDDVELHYVAVAK